MIHIYSEYTASCQTGIKLASIMNARFTMLGHSSEKFQDMHDSFNVMVLPVNRLHSLSY